MANLAQTLRQVGYVTPQGQVTGPNAPLAQQLKNYVTNVIPTAAQNLAQQRADIDAAITMGDQGIQIGDREAFERQMAQVPNLMGLTAYHGTPHTIKGKFDISKVGTGEGAQAYGHGMYFAENPKVAEAYKTQQIPAANLNAASGKSFDSIEDFFNEVKPKGVGNLYKVDIPDEYIPNMLDYDKPLLQQPPNVLKALQSVDDPYIQQAITTKPKLSKDGEYWEYMGNTYASKSEALEDATPQRIISGYTGLGKNPQEVSQALGQYGIKGVKYLDQSSRVEGKGTSNFVVFEPSNVKILEQNSKPLTRKEILEQELKKVVE
jgi:hypothetical protein